MSNLNGFFEELMRPPVRHDYARIQAEARRALERSARRSVVAAVAKRAKKRRAQRRIKQKMIKESRHRAILRNDWPEYKRLVRHPNHVPSDRRSPSPNFPWNYRSPSLSLNFGGSLPPRSQSTQGTPPAVRHYARGTPSRHHTQVPANVPETPPPRRFTQ